VWGIDTHGEKFLPEARATNISRSGALLSELDPELRCGDRVGVLYEGKCARYRLVRVRRREAIARFRPTVQRLAADGCPWEDLLPKETGAGAASAPSE